MIRVRAAEFSDLAAINAVCARNAFPGIDPENARRRWLEHPYRKDFEGVPMGWVLENGDDVVGTFSNVHAMYELNGRHYKCGCAGSWVVDPEHRNASLMLAMAYFNQKGVDFCTNGSASAVASQLMTAMKAPRIPSQGYDLAYFWITRYTRFAAAALRKKNFAAANLAAYPAGLVLAASDLVRGARGRMAKPLRRLDSFGPEFDQLWERLRQTKDRLRMVRNAACMEWRFGDRLRQRTAVALGLYEGSQLNGYVVLIRKVREQMDLRQYVIGDIQAHEDSPERLEALLRGAIRATVEDGYDALEWQGWNPEKRRVALALAPRAYRYPVWEAFYKIRNPELSQPLGSGKVWDFSLIDSF